MECKRKGGEKFQHSYTLAAAATSVWTTGPKPGSSTFQFPLLTARPKGVGSSGLRAARPCDVRGRDLR